MNYQASTTRRRVHGRQRDSNHSQQPGYNITSLHAGPLTDPFAKPEGEDSNPHNVPNGNLPSDSYSSGSTNNSSLAPPTNGSNLNYSHSATQLFKGGVTSFFQAASETINNATNSTTQYWESTVLATSNSPTADFSYGTDSVSYAGDASTTFESLTDMPCRDRSSEFRATTKSYEMKIQGNGFNHRKPAQKLLQDSIQFNQYAKKIGMDLGKTCSKLEKLSVLAKGKSLYNDPITVIEELTNIIKQDISGLNKQIAQLQESKLAAVSNQFKHVLEVRTENLKHKKSRRDQFSQSRPVPSSLPPSASTGHLGSVLLSDEQAAAGGGDVAISMDGVGDRYQEQLALIDEQDTYIQSRANTMENIESTIVELGTIFSQLATMVQEQGEMVQRIDSNIEDTSMNIEAAHTELLKYFRSISQNRWLAMKVFGVLIVFFVIFVVFLV